MRLAILSDIHGNKHALETVLEHLHTQTIDQIIIAGDTVNLLPHSKHCWDTVQALDCPILRGNHERYVFDFGTENAMPEWSEERFKGLAWIQEQFRPKDLQAMRKLPMTYHIEDLLVTHASARHDQDLIFDNSTHDELDAMFPETTAQLIIRGHQHKWHTRSWQKRKLITLGALGVPLNGTGQTQYLILEKQNTTWHAEKQFLTYNHEAALADMNDAYINAMGPLGHIFKLELKSANPQVMPFFRQYFEALESKALSLQQAVEEYVSKNSQSL